MDVGDLGVWGPKGVSFHSEAWFRGLCSPIVFLGLPVLFLSGVPRGRMCKGDAGHGNGVVGSGGLESLFWGEAV